MHERPCGWVEAAGAGGKGGVHLETHAMGELFFFHLLQAPVAHIHTLEELEIVIQSDDLIEWRVCGVAIREHAPLNRRPGNMKDKIVLHCFKPEGPGSLQATVFLIHASEHVITNVRISLRDKPVVLPYVVRFHHFD